MSTHSSQPAAQEAAIFDPDAGRFAHEAQTLAVKQEHGLPIVMCQLDSDLRNPRPEECEMLNLPSQALVQELHVTLGSMLYTLRAMRPRRRAQYAAGLVMRDWNIIADDFAQGAKPQVKGLVGVSPLARPHTLQKLGAKVRPGVLTHDDLENVDKVYMSINGHPPRKRVITQFAITRENFIASGSIAGRMADMLLCETGGV